MFQICVKAGLSQNFALTAGSHLPVLICKTHTIHRLNRKQARIPINVPDNGRSTPAGSSNSQGLLNQQPSPGGHHPEPFRSLQIKVPECLPLSSGIIVSMACMHCPDVLTSMPSISRRIRLPKHSVVCHDTPQHSVWTCKRRSVPMTLPRDIVGIAIHILTV
jgi:hypothetical protein